MRFHQFPSLEERIPVSESQLRENGFGYRAKYIVGTAEMLRQKAEGGEQWLLALRGQPLDDAVMSLCTLPGIGPKVAACIAPFSLDQDHAIPVDTHVWQIAVRYLLPELEGRKLTVKLHCEVAKLKALEAMLVGRTQCCSWRSSLLSRASFHHIYEFRKIKA